ncbi:MAG: LysR family transcriptional regulator [Clostridia bacterium]|nr:LysR family transcriptional regulator [Clostridia bacterium]
MTFKQLSYVITIAETGSLNKASEKLYVAQPSLTSAVKELERELSITIFNRTARGMTLTTEGMKFLPYARQVYAQYLNLMEEYGKVEPRKTSFAVSTQHYSFAVKAFVELAKHVDVAEYDFAIRETRTQEVINDVVSLRSEIGILYMNDFNRKPLTKLFGTLGLKSHHLIDCSAYVYLWKEHPLAKNASIAFEDLLPYPCLAFEQGGSSMYFAEELLSTRDYPRIITCCDRATVLNLMVGLNGYTLCSGIICEELSGSDYIAVPFAPDADQEDIKMELVYIERKNTIRSALGERYIEEMEKYLLPLNATDSKGGGV